RAEPAAQRRADRTGDRPRVGCAAARARPFTEAQYGAAVSETDLLAGRVALITGGGGEIGGAIARRFAAAGAAGAVADVRDDAAAEVAREITSAGGRALAVKADVSIADDARQSVARAVVEFGKLTTLVNVAATVTPDGTVESLTVDEWNAT